MFFSHIVTKLLLGNEKPFKEQLNEVIKTLSNREHYGFTYASSKSCMYRSLLNGIGTIRWAFSLKTSKYISATNLSAPSAKGDRSLSSLPFRLIKNSFI